MTAIDEIVAPLFVPGDRPERFPKAAGSGADAVILDLEDAVAADRKDHARSCIRSDVAGVTLVRINPAGTVWHDGDVAAALRAGFAAIVVPKAEATPAFASLDRAATAAGVRLVALIETARGLVEARGIAGMASVARLAFGSIDYCADLGCAHHRDALLGARSELVLASRLAARPAPIDGVTTVTDDPDTVTDDARHARALGFAGKLCIHPRQVDHVLSGFRPDEEEMAWARRVLASGSGAVAIDGAMVDEPVRVRARRILSSADQGPIGGVRSPR